VTRLVEEWLKDISTTVKQYERDLKDKTGFDFVSLAGAATGLSRQNLELLAGNNRVGVVPITAGQGIIGSFSESVAAIVRSMNFEAFVTEYTDVAGIYEAHQQGAKILFMADEDRFLAINLSCNLIADNNRATARGYVTALEGAAGELAGREVLVLGCGPVGLEALVFLREKGARPVAYDVDKKIMAFLSGKDFATLSGSGEIAGYSLIVDANPQGGWLTKGMLHPDAWIAAPGIPLSLDLKAYDFHKNRVIHDPLHIGVATMLAMACGA
jgi:3-methylornithyl-N6-L-lysine dehydrogenase